MVMLILKWRIVQGSNSSRESGQGFVSTVESTFFKEEFYNPVTKEWIVRGIVKNKMYSEEVDAEDDEII